MAVSDEHIRLILDLQKGASTEEVIKSLETLKRKAEEADRATKNLGTNTKATAQTLQGWSRAFQDFTQGGFAGILNNIEQMAAGLGPQMAANLTIVGTAAFIAFPYVKTFFQGLIDGANKIPETADKVERLTEKLKDNKDILEELHKKQSLTNTELVTYNKLTGENIKLTEQLTAAKKAQHEQEQLKEMKVPEVAAAEKERAEELYARFGGQQDEISALIDSNIENKLLDISDAMRQYTRNIKGVKTAKDDATLRAMAKNMTRIQDIRAAGGGRGLLGGALVGGREADIRGAMEFLPEGPIRGGFESTLPLQKLAQELWDEDFQKSLDERSAAVKRRNLRLKKEADRKKQIDKASEEQHKAAVEEANAIDDERMRKIAEARDFTKQAKVQVDAEQARRAQPSPISQQKLQPMRDPNEASSQLEFNNIILQNEQISLRNQRILDTQIAQGKAVQEDLREVPNSRVGQQ